MIAHMLTMIRCKHDQRVIVSIITLEVIDQATDLRIHFGHHGIVGSLNLPFISFGKR